MIRPPPSFFLQFCFLTALTFCLSLTKNQSSSNILKKPQKFESIFHLFWHLLSKRQIKWKIVSYFVAFLENLNFKMNYVLPSWLFKTCFFKRYSPSKLASQLSHWKLLFSTKFWFSKSKLKSKIDSDFILAVVMFKQYWRRYYNTIYKLGIR